MFIRRNKDFGLLSKALDRFNIVDILRYFRVSASTSIALHEFG